MAPIYVLSNPPVQGQAWAYTGFPMFDTNGDFVAIPNFVAGDVQISQDGANPVNIGSLPTPFGPTGMLNWSFSAAEMSCDTLTIICHSAGGNFVDCAFTIETLEEVEIECDCDMSRCNKARYNL